MSNGTTSFEAAELGLKEFLAKNLLPNHVMWVFREDVSSSGPKVWVRWPTPAGNIEAAKRVYDEGLDRGYGIAIRVVCKANNTACCYVWAPGNDYDARQENLMTGLRYSVVKPIPSATVVENAVAWGARKQLNLWATRSKVMSEIPARK